jgi:hypothetical protein
MSDYDSSDRIPTGNALLIPTIIGVICLIAFLSWQGITSLPDAIPERRVKTVDKVMIVSVNGEPQLFNLHICETCHLNKVKISMEGRTHGN